MAKTESGKGRMDLRAITYDQPDRKEPEVYRRLDGEVESLRELSLLGAVLAILTLFSTVLFVASFLYYRTGPHGKMRTFVLSVQNGMKNK